MKRAIFHVDDPTCWPLALANARNLLGLWDAAGEAFEIELLANAAAVGRLTEHGSAELGGAMGALAAEGVRFAACRIAMGNLRIAEKDLLPFVGSVPSGVAELAEKQEAGFAYIKP